jgi:hypothetical protein
MAPVCSLGASFRSPLRAEGGGVAVWVCSSLAPPSRLGFFADLCSDSGSGLGCDSDSAEYSRGTFSGVGDEGSRREGSTGGKGRLGFGEK